MTDEAIASLGDESGARSPTVYCSWILGVARLFVWSLLTFTLCPIQEILIRLNHPLSKKIPQYYHRQVAKIFGLKFVVKGAPSSQKPILFVANHSSYLDINVMGALIPGRFVSKAEISGWFIFGWLARLQNTVFIERKRKEVSGQKNKMVELLKEGVNLMLFPEGTTGDGIHMLPFKSSLFGVAQEGIENLKIQPMSISYSHIDGFPVGRHLKPLISWYGDMTLVGHMIRLLGLGTIQVTVVFHEPIDTSGKDRKQLAQQSYQAVESGLVDRKKEKSGGVV